MAYCVIEVTDSRGAKVTDSKILECVRILEENSGSIHQRTGLEFKVGKPIPAPESLLEAADRLKVALLPPGVLYYIAARFLEATGLTATVVELLPKQEYFGLTH